MTMRERLFFLILAWNVMVWLTYGLDKRKAIRKDWRIPEKVLLMESWILGGLGAILGGYLFRHKIRKWYFQVTWWLSLALLGGVCHLILTYLPN